MRWTSWLGLKSIPGKSTLHDWLELFDLKIIRLLIRQHLVEEKPSLMAIDATGVDSWQRSRHYQLRIGEEHMLYAKVDLLVDTKTKLVHDFALRVRPRHDVLGAKTILKRMQRKAVKILGDKGYDAESLYQLAHDRGNQFYAPVRKSSRNIPKGRFRKIAAHGDKDYPQRNIVESTIHSLKQKGCGILRSKNAYMKKREMGWKIIVHNMEILERIIHIILWHLKMPFRTEPISTIPESHKRFILFRA